MKSRKWIAFILSFLVACAAFPATGLAARADIAAVSNGVAMDLKSASACLMEASTGEVLYEYNADEKLEPASVTKIMTLLLVMEALDNGVIKLDDMVTGSMNASKMGGSQIWLEYGEQFSVDDMLKAVVVVSANDCTMALAEHLAGSEEAFVARMNERAAELGMINTQFKNCSGLPEEGHYTTARDIAIMSRELIKHDQIFNYTMIWMDSLRDGQMGLSNTNKLIRFYPGANGLKTGFTSSAGYCLSGTAKRDKLQLIASVMKAPSSDERFEDTKKLLDYGFANFEVYEVENGSLDPLPVTGGTLDTVEVGYDGQDILLPKGRQKLVEQNVILDESIKAPVAAGQKVGVVKYTIEGEEIGSVDIVTLTEVPRVGYGDILMRILKKLTLLR